MHRSLILAPASIGDAVSTQPLVAALARRGVVVTVAAHHGVAPVYRAMGPAVASVIELPLSESRLALPARWSVGRSWQRRYDLAYVLQDSFRSALMPWFAQIARRVGYLGQGRHLLLNAALPNEAAPQAPVARWLRLAGLDVADAEAPAASLQLPADRVAAALAKFELDAGAYWVLAPGSRSGPARRWPPAHFARLAQALHGHAGLPVVLLGLGDEMPLAEHIAARLDDVNLRVLAGRTQLDEALALIAGSAGMVGNDSGLSVAGAALGRPVVTLYGPTRPLPGSATTSARSCAVFLSGAQAPACAPCAQANCAAGHLRCLQDLAPERVAQAALGAAGLAPLSMPAPARRVVGGH